MINKIEVFVNGILEPVIFGSTICDLLILKAIDPSRIVVEVNQNIIKRDKYDSYRLSGNDKVEILRFVGGG